MRTILNLVWLVLCGLWMALGYFVAGLVLCALIITIPFGVAAFRIASYALWPFGRTVVPRRLDGPTTRSGYRGSPRAYSCWCSNPSRKMVSHRWSDRALTTDTPTPCRPPDTL